MKKRLLSLFTVMTVAMAFVISFSVADDDVFVSAAAKKYPLPKSIKTLSYEEDEFDSYVSKIKYDKFGNMKSALVSEMIPIKYTMKYRNKKGKLASLVYTDGEYKTKKTYDKKGRLLKINNNGKVYKYKTNKKGIITKVTCDGELYYKVKSISYQKNGFVSKVVYGNGNVNKYNSDGLLSSVSIKGEKAKYKYEYTKKSGKIVKMVIKRNGKMYAKTTLKYGKAKTKDPWKWSCIVGYGGGPTNACELASKCSLGGINSLA